MWFKKKIIGNKYFKKYFEHLPCSTAQMVSIESRTLDMFHSDKTGELIWKLLCQLAVCLSVKWQPQTWRC